MMENGTEVAAKPVSNASDISKFAYVIAEAFSNDALNRYLFLGQESQPDHPKLKQLDLRTQHWLPLIQTRSEKGGILLQACDFAAVALWFPPGVERPAPNILKASEVILEYREKFDGLKKRTLGDQHYWYLNLIGRSTSKSGKGAVRALIEPFLKSAREQGIPVWLEATNEHARDIYAYFGFRVVEEVTIGHNIINSDGWVQSGGNGVRLWGMVAGL